MNYIIVNNLDSNAHHLSKLKQLFSESDEVLIASPFLMTDFGSFFADLRSISTVRKLDLITTLCPKNPEQIRKVRSLVSLLEVPEIKNKHLKCTVSLNNRLHGKVYIFWRNQLPISAIISSANFTNTGLIHNHEWGIEISEPTVIDKLQKDIRNAIQYPNISRKQIVALYEKVNEFQSTNRTKEELQIALSLVNEIPDKARHIPQTSELKYWLKPIGYTEGPVEDGRYFGNEEQELNFSTQKPTGVQYGDILIAYGVGNGKILSIYRCISLPIHATDEEIEEDDWLKRWPWYVIGENVTPNFGSRWWNHKLYLSSLAEEYLRRDPKASLTWRGNNSLGGIQFGKDKIRLAPEFAQYIIAEVVDKN